MKRYIKPITADRKLDRRWHWDVDIYKKNLIFWIERSMEFRYDITPDKYNINITDSSVIITINGNTYEFPLDELRLDFGEIGLDANQITKEVALNEGLL